MVDFEKTELAVDFFMRRVSSSFLTENDSERSHNKPNLNTSEKRSARLVKNWLGSS